VSFYKRSSTSNGLEGHGFSRAVNDTAIAGFHGKPGQVSR
jgi:hypothetical protein